MNNLQLKPRVIEIPVSGLLTACKAMPGGPPVGVAVLPADSTSRDISKTSVCSAKLKKENDEELEYQ